MGLAAIGDQNNVLGISATENKIMLWKYQNGEEEILAEEQFSGNGSVQLKVEVEYGEQYTFFWSEDGTNWKIFDNANALDGAYLPPWTEPFA